MTAEERAVLSARALPGETLRRGTSIVDRVIGRILDVVIAMLVAVEVAVLGIGVATRTLGTPLTWTDELASILFLWLATLGAAAALRRGEHMRMGVLVEMASPTLRAFLQALAPVAAVAFLAFLLEPAYEYAQDEAFITTPALGIANSWRAAAMPVGLGLMLVLALLRIVGTTTRGATAAALLFAACLVAALHTVAPALSGAGNLNLVIFFVGVVGACVLAGVPIAFAFGLSTLGYLSFTTSMPTSVLVSRMDEGMSHIILLAVPLFVFLGLLIELTGMAKAMIAFLASLLGHVRGGLSYVLVGAMYLVSGISGSKAADMAAIAPALFPEMKARGAKPGDLVALLATTGAQTETVPPSLVLITIGSATGVSIAALFTGGLVPGAVLGFFLFLVIRFRYRNEDLSGVRRASWGEIGRSFAISLPALALPFVIRAAVVEGIATATEVSVIGIAYALVIGFVAYGRYDWRRLGPILVETASLSGAILLIIGAATGMAWGLTQSGFSSRLAAAMTGLPGGSFTFMLVSILAFVVLGSVLEGIPAIVLFGPLLFPIAKQVGINEVHYAMVVVISMGIGLFTPPLGVGYYTACAIGRVDPAEGVRPILGYMLAAIAGLALVAAFPWLSTGFL
jgi:tripartite ATP-independent transporter DctM subunit